jgi:hypothetical protein
MPFFRQRPDGDRQKGNVIDNIKLSSVLLSAHGRFSARSIGGD